MCFYMIFFCSGSKLKKYLENVKELVDREWKSGEFSTIFIGFSFPPTEQPLTIYTSQKVYKSDLSTFVTQYTFVIQFKEGHFHQYSCRICLMILSTRVSLRESL